MTVLLRKPLVRRGNPGLHLLQPQPPPHKETDAEIRRFVLREFVEAQRRCGR